MRLFVAAWPDEPTRERLSALALAPTEGLRMVEPGQWHITLRFLGHVGAHAVPDLVGALGTAAGGLGAPIHCEVGPATAWFSGNRVLQIPVSGLDEAARVVRVATRPVVPGTGDTPPGFTGHLTVARAGRRGVAAATRATLAGIPFRASFEVDSFDLVVSEPGAEGFGYRTLARASLPG